MKIFVFLLSLLIPLLLGAQKSIIKFGEVPMEDLKMSIYELDSSAEAVVLADYGETAINYYQGQGFQLEFNRIKRLKILKKSGYDWGNMIIPVYKTDSRDEKLSGLKASTFNLENGKVTETKLSKESIFQEKATDNWHNTRVALPNVREGSVIDIAYKIISPFLFNLQDWQFQDRIPVRWSEYVVKIPQYLEYEKYMQGYVSLDVDEQTSEQKFINLQTKDRTVYDHGSTKTTYGTERINYEEKRFRWAVGNVPSFQEEPYMANSIDYISKINFELATILMPGSPVENIMGTWENINKELQESSSLGGALRKSNVTDKLAQELTSGKTNDIDKVSSVYTYVKKQVEWNGYYRKYTNGNFKKILEDRKGTSADINLLLINLLRASGLRSWPVAISTRDHGFIRPQFPLSSQFNYVICLVQVNDKTWLLDATDRSLPITTLPERCLNGQGLIIAEDNTKWVDLKTNIKNRSVVESTLSFDDEAKLKCDVHVTREGYEAQRMRIKYISKGEENYLGELKQQTDWLINKIEFENITDLGEPVRETLSMAEASGNASSDILYIQPFISNYLEKNPFKQEERKYPVDFGAGFEKIYMTVIQVPDGYIVDELPANMAITLPDKGGRFIYNINQLGNSLRVTSQLVVPRSLFTQEEYPFLREFYAKMSSKQEEMVVLKKSN